MAVEQDSAGSVVLTEDCTVDVVKAIPGHQSVSTGGTAETLQRTQRNSNGSNSGHYNTLTYCEHDTKRAKLDVQN